MWFSRRTPWPSNGHKESTHLGRPGRNPFVIRRKTPAMKRLLFVVLCCLTSFPAGADVTASSDVTTNRELVGGNWQLTTDTYTEAADITLDRRDGLRSSGGAPEIYSEAFVRADTHVCSGIYTLTCVDTLYPKQPVPVTSYTLDRSTGDATLDVCLVPDGGGDCREFSLTLAGAVGQSSGMCNGGVLIACAYVAPYPPETPQYVSVFGRSSHGFYDYESMEGSAPVGTIREGMFRYGYADYWDAEFNSQFHIS